MVRYRYPHIISWLILLGLILAVLAAPSSLAVSAPHAQEQKAQTVTIYPTTLYYGDSIEITVTRFMPEYGLPAGSRWPATDYRSQGILERPVRSL